MSPRRSSPLWLLPAGPDVLALLSGQAHATCRGLDAFAAWAQGDAAQSELVREAEHECDHLRRQVVQAVRDAFSTPLQPEDLFQLSQGLDRVINAAKDTVREAEVMSIVPDTHSAEMAQHIRDGVHSLAAAIAGLDRRALATSPRMDAADAAVKAQRRLEKAYRHAISALLEHDDLRTAIGYREMYRRLVGMSEDVVTVADRITYAIVKQS